MPVDTKTKDGRVTTSKQVGYKRKDGKEEWYNEVQNLSERL